MHLAGFGMGSETDTKTRPGLEFNRHITGYCIGTQPLVEVALIRNGKVFRTLPLKEEQCESKSTTPISSVKSRSKLLQEGRLSSIIIYAPYKKMAILHGVRRSGLIS